MTLRTLIRRSLRFHWRSHLGVVIGAAIGSAALIGALIVGDSVKGSLRERALERLGGVNFALDAGDRTFQGDLSTRMLGWLRTNPPGVVGNKLGWAGWISPRTRLSATAIASGGTARAQQVNVYLTPDGFIEPPIFDRVKYKKFADADGEDTLFVNQSLASQLQVGRNETILFRLKQPGLFSPDSPLGSSGNNSFTLRLKVSDIVSPAESGDFSLRAQTPVPMNAFVCHSAVSNTAFAHDRANLLLTQNAWYERPARAFAPLGKVKVWLSEMFPMFGHVPQPNFHLTQVADLQKALGHVWKLADAQIVLSLLPSSKTEIELHTSRVFLDPPVVRSSLTADSNAQPLLTYLANLITVGSNAAPYSMVTAAGAPWTPPELHDDEIVLNQWLAEDLQAKPGDAVTLVYYHPESGARLTERTNTFRVHSIVPMQMPWADRTLMPQFPGIEKAETTADWDTAFPLVHKIRPQDDDYWTAHRGTPKAFITLAAGQKMWANRFGNLTAIRFPIPTNFVSSTSALTPALSPGERGNRSPSPGQSKGGDISTTSGQPKSAQSLSPLPGGEGKGEGERSTKSIETFRAALEKKILATLKPEELGLRFEPVREQALKAAEQSQDFGGLFIGFSLFVIVAALLLMAMLFQFSLEQRAAEIGTLLALGFTPKQVRRLFLGEGAALAFIGGLIGTLGGIGYARAMLHGLTTVWRDAVGASTLKFFITPQTLTIGLFASTLVAVFTLWLALRKQARRPARELLAGEDGGWRMEGGGAKRRRGGVVGTVAFIAAVGLVGWTFAKGDTANAGAFFGAGALVLIAGLCLLNARLARRSQPSSILNLPSSSKLAVRGLARRCSRSVATVAMLASGTFLIVSIGVFRLDANRDATQRTSGTGGFALVGESTMPVVADLNTKAGRETFALNEADFADVNFVQFRVRAGDEASCLNLNRAQKPRLLGVRTNALTGRFAFTKLMADTSVKTSAWSLLSKTSVPDRAPVERDEIPAIGDAASIQWAMGKKVGDTLDYVDERGQPFKVRIVGAVANSILQGQLIIDEAEFVKRFPGESGYKYFLIDTPTNRVADVSAKLSRALQDSGLELTPVPQRLAQFNAVQNTYLGTFQILGGLGLLLGSAGLGIVVLRNVLERRGELAVLLAVGWRRSAVNQLVLREHLALLGLGLATGLVAAIVAVLPSLLTPGAEFPWFTLSLTLAGVLANGVFWTWLATRVALRGELLSALRGE